MMSEATWADLKAMLDAIPPPKRHAMDGWNAGDLCRIDGKHLHREKGRMYDARILETAFSHEGDYLQTKLEITATVKGMDGKPITQTWTHPKPVQSYKLRKPLLKDED
jgi:hypothetical protein